MDSIQPGVSVALQRMAVAEHVAMGVAAQEKHTAVLQARWSVQTSPTCVAPVPRLETRFGVAAALHSWMGTSLVCLIDCDPSTSLRSSPR